MMNRQIVLASRPQGHPMIVNFKTEEMELAEIKTGEVLLKPLMISVDPYMRERMNDIASTIDPFQLDQPIDSGIVATVIESKSKTLKKGDTVTGILPWASLSIAKADQLRKIDTTIAPAGYYLGLLGRPGLTAYFGLMEIGKPKAGETVVVSAAAGAVGLIVGQLAKIQGCRVIGIVGSNDKCRLLKDKFGFDEAINYKTSHSLERAIAAVCPKGVDIYFDNVGGTVTDAVIANIKQYARVILCGQISSYNIAKAMVGPRLFPKILSARATMQGFMVNDYSDRFPEAYAKLEEWMTEGKLKYKQTVLQGFDKLPQAFLGLFSGENQGKMLVEMEGG
jgi:NADPH:quinone reductase